MRNQRQPLVLTRGDSPAALVLTLCSYWASLYSPVPNAHCYAMSA